jgi:hypothetical protein
MPLSNLEGVDYLVTKSLPNASVIIANLKYGTDLDKSMQDAQRYIDNIRKDLPARYFKPRDEQSIAQRFAHHVYQCYEQFTGNGILPKNEGRLFATNPANERGGRNHDFGWRRKRNSGKRSIKKN